MLCSILDMLGIALRAVITGGTLTPIDVVNIAVDLKAIGDYISRKADLDFGVCVCADADPIPITKGCFLKRMLLGMAMNR